MPVEQDRIDEIKRKTDLSALVQKYGIELSKKGKDLVGLCPFHEEKTPSFTVTPAKNLFHCFGCGAGGDVIEFVRKMEKTDFPGAIEKLSSFSGGVADSGDSFGNTGKKSAGETENEPETLSEELTRENHELLDSIVSHYQRSLKNNPEALRYLESRGLFNEEAFTKFRIGYAAGDLSRVLPNDQKKTTRIRKEYLRSVGILREKHHEHFEGCLTFPIFDQSGSLSEMYGRSINYRARNKHLYLPGPHKGIFNPDALNSPELILCESVIDALTFYVNDLRNVTCSFGVEGFTDELFEAIKSGSVKTVLFAYDRDVAGDTAAGKLALRLKGEGIEVKRIRFPVGMDANEYAVKYAPAADALLDLVRNAGPVEEETETPAIRFEDIPDKKKSSQTPEFEVDGDEIRFTFSERAYRVRGLFKNTSDHAIKINLKVSRGDVYYLDTFDLLSAKARQHFIDSAAREIAVTEDILKYDLGRVLAKIEEIQERRLKENLESAEDEVTVPEDRKERAVEYLKDPDLIKNIVLDFERLGLVGERINSLIGYLGVISRKTDTPLAVIVQSSSSAGKSTLMEAVLALVPEEDRIKFSMMTGQSLYYMQSRKLSHKIIAISEEEGMERAKYAIKILQSERKIIIATTIKDPVSGLPDTKEFIVEGPVMFILTTTNTEIDEEIQNRSVVITINENRDQTRMIQNIQRKRRTLEGIEGKRNVSAITELHADAQRMLRPLPVVIPFAEEMDFPDTELRMRRDHEKFLTLIESVAFLHQYQREIKSNGEFEYIVATEEDAALAAFLAAEVFGISLGELAPHTRKLLDLIDSFVTEECEKLEVERRQFRFTRRQIREYTKWTDSRLKKHLARLEDLEYMLVHGGGRGQFIEYELIYNGEGRDGEPFLPGVHFELSPKILNFLKEKSPLFDEKSRQNGEKSPPGHGQVTPKTPPGHTPKIDQNPYKTADFDEKPSFSPKTHIREQK